MTNQQRSIAQGRRHVDVPDQTSFTMRRYPLLQTILEGETEARNLADRIYDHILMRIVRSEFQGGSELKSTELAAEYGVSRTPVNHALACLASDGIVLQQANRRAIVRPGAENWLVDIHQLRCEIEPGAARASAGKIPEDMKADLMMLARDVRSLSGEAWVEGLRCFDYALHLVVAECCGNLAIRQTLRKCWVYKRLSYGEVLDTEEELTRGYEEHIDILNHLHVGNGPGAATTMRLHLKAAARNRAHQRFV